MANLESKCNERFEDSGMHHIAIIAHLHSSFKVQLHKGNITSEALSFFEITPSVNVRLFQLVRWLPLALGWFKLNMDGACKNNPEMATAGGVLKDNNNNFFGAFTSFLGSQTSAKAKAIFIGINFAISLYFLSCGSKQILSSLVISWMNYLLFLLVFHTWLEISRWQQGSWGHVSSHAYTGKEIALQIIWPIWNCCNKPTISSIT